MITRYHMVNFDDDFSEMREHPYGEFIEYSEHQLVVRRLEDKIEELEDELKVLGETND